MFSVFENRKKINLHEYIFLWSNKNKSKHSVSFKSEYIMSLSELYEEKWMDNPPCIRAASVRRKIIFGLNSFK